MKPRKCIVNHLLLIITTTSQSNPEKTIISPDSTPFSPSFLRKFDTNFFSLTESLSHHSLHHHIIRRKIIYRTQILFFFFFNNHQCFHSIINIIIFFIFKEKHKNPKSSLEICTHQITKKFQTKTQIEISTHRTLTTTAHYLLKRRSGSCSEMENSAERQSTERRAHSEERSECESEMSELNTR